MNVQALLRVLRLLPLAALGMVIAGTSARAQAKPARIDSPFLWKVDGAHTPSYLFGTIHAGVSARELPAKVGAAIDASELFIMETAPTQPMQRRASALPMDLALADYAHKSGSRILTLETLRFQMDLLQKLGSQEEIAAMLAQEEEGSELHAIANAYRTGDLDALAAATGPADAETQELLLDSRNRRWSEKLSPVLAKGGAFVAVGAGHMAGPSGLLALLRDRGFSVERVS